MADEKKRKGGGSKLSRSQTVTVRLDPKLRYLATLAARTHRRTLSSFIEWAIEESLKTVLLTERNPEGRSVSVADEAESLWDVDEADRLGKLAENYPQLLTHEEQLVWKFIQEHDYFWEWVDIGPEMEDYKERRLRFDLLRDHWEILNAVVRGEAEPSSLGHVFSF